MAYRVTNPPSDEAEFRRWVFQELQRLQQELAASQETLRLVSTDVAPPKPRNGEVRYTAGTWNPGAGAGVYAYVGGAWAKLN